MANKQLENRAISLFCENMAMLLGAGISAEEAAGLLAGDSAEGLQQAAAAIQKHLLVQGGTLAEAVEAGGCVPGRHSRRSAGNLSRADGGVWGLSSAAACGQFSDGGPRNGGAVPGL